VLHIILIIYILIILTLFLPTKTFAENCYLLTNFGTSNVNGTYTEYSTYNSKPTYFNQSNYIFWMSSGYWLIKGSITDNNSLYYIQSNDATPPTGTSWILNLGTPPAGTVSTTECEEEPPETPANTGSTTSATLNDVTLGLGIIITLMFLGYIGFIFNRISSKKPWK